MLFPSQHYDVVKIFLKVSSVKWLIYVTMDCIFVCEDLSEKTKRDVNNPPNKKHDINSHKFVRWLNGHKIVLRRKKVGIIPSQYQMNGRR